MIGNLNTGRITFEGCRFVPTTYFDQLDWSRRPRVGDLLYTVTGSFGIAVPVETDAFFCVQRHVAILKCVPSSPAAYLLQYLKTPSSKAYSEAVATGIAQKTVTLGALRQMPVALPPLAEQHRIVAKVDELMALCDRLEAEQTDAESAHARLVDTLLGTLTQSADAAELAANWQRLAEHFDTLFTTESSLDALKQAVLQLAVMGKLVPQDPNDEPASELLKRVAKERARLEAEGACKKSKAMPLMSEDEWPFELPKNWEWVAFSATWESSFYGPRFGTDEYVRAGGVPTIRTTDMQDGVVVMRNPPCVSVSADKLMQYKLKHGDLLVTRSGSIGTLALYESFEPAIPSAYLIRLRFLSGLLPTYSRLFLLAPLGQGFLGLTNFSISRVIPGYSGTLAA